MIQNNNVVHEYRILNQNQVLIEPISIVNNQINGNMIYTKMITGFINTLDYHMDA